MTLQRCDSSEECCKSAICKCTRKIKHVNTDYTLKICDQVIFVEVEETERTVTLPHSSTFPLCDKMRSYTITKNGKGNTKLFIKLSGDDKWYLDRGYDTKVLRGHGEMVTLQLIASKEGKSYRDQERSSYWACIDDIVTTFRANTGNNAYNFTEVFSIPWQDPNVEIDNGQIIDGGGGPDIRIGIDGRYDLWAFLELNPSSETSSEIVQTALVVNDSILKGSRTLDVVATPTHIIFLTSYVPSVDLKAGDIVKYQVVRAPFVSGDMIITSARVVIRQKDMQS